MAEAVPPPLYGGTERIVSHLTEELVALGHEVTLFASGDSRTAARLEAAVPRALRLGGPAHDPSAPHALMLARLRDFDAVHFHLDHLHLPLMRAAGDATPFLTTQHGRLDLPGLAPLFRAFPEAPLVSISHAQRRPLPFAGWAGTVLHVPDALAEVFGAVHGRHDRTLLVTPRGVPWTTVNAQETMLRMRRILGLDRYTLHGLRATGPSKLAQGGVALAAIMALTGHQSERTLRDYLRGVERSPLAAQVAPTLAQAAGGTPGSPLG